MFERYVHEEIIQILEEDIITDDENNNEFKV